MAKEPADEYGRAVRSLLRATEDCQLVTDHAAQDRWAGVDEESGPIAEADAEAILTMARAFDETDARVSLPSGLYDKRATSHKDHNTLASWVERLTIAAKNLTLTDTDAQEINTWTTSLVQEGKPLGDDEDEGDREDYSRSHIRNVEYALSKFFRVHADLGVDTDGITIHQYEQNGGNGWDARDLLEPEERAALRKVADHPRDRAALHLALYTGLRSGALRSLRVKDVLPEQHEWHFNTEADGLKQVHRPDEPRPLFQAERAVKDWLEYHPDPQPENPLLTAKPEWSRADPTKPLSGEQLRQIITGLAEKTRERDDVVSVEKPCHPHMLRHNFVSMCRKHPDITDAQIKFYLGHAPGSDVMETTYSHLSSDDWNEAGHNAFGVDDAATDGDETPPWDTTCQQCDRVLSPGQDECEACGTDRGETPWQSDDEILKHLTPTERNEITANVMGGLLDEMSERTDIDFEYDTQEMVSALLEAEDRRRALEAEPGDIRVVDGES
jgi:integrase